MQCCFENNAAAQFPGPLDHAVVQWLHHRAAKLSARVRFPGAALFRISSRRCWFLGGCGFAILFREQCGRAVPWPTWPRGGPVVRPPRRQAVGAISIYGGGAFSYFLAAVLVSWRMLFRTTMRPRSSLAHLATRWSSGWTTAPRGCRRESCVSSVAYKLVERAPPG